MNSGMPELGSKISLISKADIRYEGRLFTVDPQECTIALASVRSFGTEDRESKFPVPAQNQVYDYILFRGSDIKDIRVVNTQPLNDPAIVQLSVPPSLGGSANFPGQPFPHPVLGHIGGPGPLGPYPQSLGGPMGGMSGLGGNIAPGVGMAYDPRLGKQSELSAPLQMEPLQPAPPAHEQESHDLIGGSRSSTPGLLSRKSPTMDAGVQCSQPKDDKKPMQNRAVQPPNRDGRNSQNRDRRGEHEQRPQFRNYRDPQQQQHQNNDRNQQRGQPNRGGWVNNRGTVRQRGRGRGGPNQNFQRAPGQQPGHPQQQAPQQQGAAGGNAQGQKKTLKFEGDYDFEQANTQFEELRVKLAKAKLDADNASTKVNGEANSEKKDDSGNETGVEINEPEEEIDQSFYDKTKSFFDNISCEAVERSKGRSQRTDWRIERKLNSETFGVASARRGAYRGRGYYRGGMGGGYRGGYRGNYRGGRGGYNQRSNQGNPNSVPASAQAQQAGK
ncbi:hypothetical protein ONE63_006417 [Megalurothrips usitatus]|uniref:Protein LSM14 homolog B n=1 Tax=Megalurothrips usitatus TaxID=439358 RepID=A0AAV7XTB3_9NEOP|nr:hypothetical protein ONE63_006417 [Megalurothrips usitatus]